MSCSKSPSGADKKELNSHKELLDAGLKYRTDPGNQTSAYRYLHLLVENGYYVTACTILDEQSEKYSRNNEFIELYADIIRKSALYLWDSTGIIAYTTQEGIDARLDTLLRKIDRIRKIDSLIREKDSDTYLHLERGILFLQLTNYQAAGYDFRKAFLLAPEGYLPYYYIIYLDYLREDYTQALLFLNQHKDSIIYNSRNRETVDHLENLLKRLTAIEQDKLLDEKVRNLERAKIILGTGDYGQALKLVNKAIDQDDHYGDAFAMRALIYHEMNLHEQALTDLEKAEKISGRLNTPLAKKIRNY